jgi:hypothetical protein
MKFCMPHWNELREKVVAHGMESLIAKSGEDIHARMVAAIEGGPKPTTFDPLMAAHNAILIRALDTAGLAVMAPNEDGSERCPLCFLIANCPCGRGDACPIRTWTTGATDAMKVEAIRFGLIGSDTHTPGSAGGGT